MTKTVFETYLREITHLRFHCQKCGARADLPLKAPRAFEQCPGCGDVLNPVDRDCIKDLRRALRAIQEGCDGTGKPAFQMSIPTEKDA